MVIVVVIAIFCRNTLTRNGELRRLIRLYSYRDTAGAKTLDRALPAPSTRLRYGDPDPKEERTRARIFHSVGFPKQEILRGLSITGLGPRLQNNQLV